MYLLVHHPEDAGVANHDDNARNNKGDGKEGRFTAASIGVLQYRARSQFIVVAEYSCEWRST